MKVLVVDDNAANRIVLARMLKIAGCEVVCLENGQQAVDFLDVETPDLIFMDLSMPIMDGFEATRLIREKHSAQSIPIFAVSANVTNEYEARCEKMGFNDFIPKPISRNRIERAVEII